MLADRREAVHANADGGHVALLGQLGGALAMFPAAPSGRFCTMLVARLREPGGRPAGFPLWSLRNWGIFLAPLLVLGFAGAGRRRPENACVGGPRRGGPKKPRRFWRAPRPRNEKPGAVSRAGLGHTPKDIFLDMNPVSTSRSDSCSTSCTEVTSCTTHRLYSASQEVFVGHPIVGVRPMKIPARFPDRGLPSASRCSGAKSCRWRRRSRLQRAKGLPVFFRVARCRGRQLDECRSSGDQVVRLFW